MTQPFSLLLQSPAVFAVIFIAGIGGSFQYGFHISVMTSPSLFIKELVNQTCAVRYGLPLEEWQVSLIWSFLVSIFCIGGLLGTLATGQLTAKFGRKKSLLVNNLVAICGAVLMLLSKTSMSFEMIMAARFLYGVSSGVSLSVHPLYVVECSPKRLRGMVGVTVATFISGGKFFGQLLGIRDLLGTEERWPFLLGFSGFTAMLQLVTLPLLPESPRYLLLDQGDRQGCEKAIRRLWGPKDYTTEVQEMLEEHAAQKGIRRHTTLELLQNPKIRWQVLTIALTFMALQLSGINSVYLYSFEVLRAVGMAADQLRYGALGMGLCELTTSMACFMIIENTGKKVLIVRGYLGMTVALALLTITLYLQNEFTWMPYCSLVLIFLNIIFFSSGPAGATSTLPGEIFTQPFKTAAFTFACTLNWICIFLVGMLFPLIVAHLRYFCFLIFLCCCLLTGLFVRFNVPETKNRTVLEITAEFQRMHSKAKTVADCTLDPKSNQTAANGIFVCQTAL